MESAALQRPSDQGDGFVLTYCHLGKTLWEVDEWPLGGEPGAAVLAATRCGREGLLPNPRALPWPGCGLISQCNPIPAGPELQARLCLHLFELKMQSPL